MFCLNANCCTLICVLLMVEMTILPSAAEITTAATSLEIKATESAILVKKAVQPQTSRPTTQTARTEGTVNRKTVTSATAKTITGKETSLMPTMVTTGKITIEKLTAKTANPASNDAGTNGEPRHKTKTVNPKTATPTAAGGNYIPGMQAFCLWHCESPLGIDIKIEIF